MLANIYLHYALDLWFERVVRPKQQGRCRMIRYADDFVVCFECRHEAEAFEQALRTRLAKFGLEVAADKTKTLRFGHHGGPHNGRFDFLGFEFYWELDRKGQPRVKRRTATKKWRALDSLLERFQVPRPRIVEKRGQKMPCQQELSFCQRLLKFLRPKVSLLAHA